MKLDISCQRRNDSCWLSSKNRRLPSTWLRAINLIATKKVDVSPVITHLLLLEKTKEGFEALIHRKGLKVILNP